MIRPLSFCVLACCGIVLAASQPPQSTSMAGSRANVSKATIEGLVRDVACPIQNLDASPTNMSLKCVQDCVKGGSPLVILTRTWLAVFPHCRQNAGHRSAAGTDAICRQVCAGERVCV